MTSASSIPCWRRCSSELQRAGVEEPVGSALFYAGYWSEANLAQALPEGPELLVATTNDWKQRKALRERGCPRGRIPKRLSLKERMERKLLTRQGRALYRLRSQQAEPPFGQIKDGRGFDRFLPRGKRAARTEWRLICATHHLPGWDPAMAPPALAHAGSDGDGPVPSAALAAFGLQRDAGRSPDRTFGQHPLSP